MSASYTEKANGNRASATKSDMDDNPDSSAEETSLTKIKRIWIEKTGIDLRTYGSMFKGALAPTIVVAAYQSTAWAETYTTIGYLVGITTVLALVIQPRAKFIETMIVNVLTACISAAFALLAMFCSIRARIGSIGFRGAGTGGQGTSGIATQGAATSEYNSSASAVAGVFLFVWIFGISAVRAKRPQLTIPSILGAIFANISMVYAPQFSTMAQATVFAKHLLEAFLTGFAVATGVSLLVFPLNSRQVVTTDMGSYVSSLQAAIAANYKYMRSLENDDMFAPHRINTAGEEVAGSAEAKEFKAKMQELAAVHAKFSVDISFAKREVAIGKAGPDDLQQLYKLLRLIMTPTLGLSCMSDVFQRIAEEIGWDCSHSYANMTEAEASTDNERARIESIQEWHDLMKILREPFGKVTRAIDEGLTHVAILLQLKPTKPTRAPQDAVESDGDEPQPGDAKFVEVYNRKSLEFLESKKVMLRGWCRLHDIELSPDFFDNPYSGDISAPKWMNDGDLTGAHRKLRRQLFLCLYMEFLLFNVSRRVYDLILFAESLRSSGKLSKNRLVVPGLKRVRKYVFDMFKPSSEGNSEQQIDSSSNTNTVYLGQAYKAKKNPEHLPPSNAWERYSDKLRTIAHFFASSSSAFGFRVACATMSIAVVAYLRDTQIFYTKERLFWSQIMISISMSPSAGQSLRNFLLRIFGTFVAVVLSFIAFYIVDGKTTGVIIMYFIFLHGGVYILLKHPSLTPVGMIGQITLTLVLGYTLQVRKIGVEKAESNGQQYYPIYLLAPFRLATVCGGLFLAWIWTIFPYPISEHANLRQSLASSLYLLANYYSVMHETLKLRLRDSEGDTSLKSSPGYQLEKSRNKIFAKANVVLAGLRAQSGFIRYDIPIGGRFPQKRYAELIDLLQSTLNFMALISLASGSFTDKNFQEQQNQSKWLSNFRKLVKDANITSQAITTLLSLLSACVANGQPLPPYLRVPEPYLLSTRLEELDKDILSVRHIAEPGYSSFAVVQIATRCIVDDLKEALEKIKELVGELDFSYHIVSTADSSTNELEETLTYTKSRPQQPPTLKHD
ncbi:Hypothetical protein R9X50_00478700 [Acrodontium crateriforme]|uniref:ER transporter 6TM N-terminal domain-containing protein n=1 Tax=Acrodontium crateriforme TaxID=150365 RepID=A0AAQ3RCY4_9PEZI|nr:Hypothetical protein R9X50_00478700 [Acrodontium crateriforme]